MPVPYLGSKRKSAGKIYQTIKNLNPNSSVLVDLFCGGLAISEYFIKQGWNVIANDKNKYVIELARKTIFEGLEETEVTKFVTREKFNQVMDNPDYYDDWYVGYVMCVWSFGNNQKSYLFGKDTEPYKRAGHELVINKNQDLIKDLIPSIPQKYLNGILGLDNWHKRRIALRKVSVALKTRIFELQRLQQLQQLERLQQLEQLQQLQRLELYSSDYREVKIPKEAIIYCDPPYKGVETYREDGFNHDEFWDWAREQSKTNKIYISEYQAPDDFKIVLRFNQNSTYAGGNNKDQPDECLFTIKNKLKTG